MRKKVGVASSLVPCLGPWGLDEIRIGNPEDRTFDDVLYTPFAYDGCWGLFDRSGEPLPGSVDLRGTDGENIHQIPRLDIDGSGVPFADEAEYVYGGRFNPHYGHFLVETLPRLWWLAREPLGERKVLMHAGRDFSWRPHYRFASDIWDALGLSPDRLVTFDHPVRLPRVRVPAPALQQQVFAYTAFRDLCLRIAARLIGEGPFPVAPKPVYLSKTRLALAVGVFEREEVIERQAAACGFEIVHPQELSLADQVRLFETRYLIVGPGSSAFHTCVFARQQPRQVQLSPLPLVNTNFTLMERLTGAEAQHLYQLGTSDIGADARAQMWRRLPDPEGAARDLVRIALSSLPEGRLGRMRRTIASAVHRLLVR